VIDFEPSEEQQMIVETVRQFAANELRPLARSIDESGEVPGDLLEQAHALGLVANALPEAHGGGGERSALTAALVAEELAWGDLSAALAVLSPTLLGLPLLDHGSDAQRERLLPRLLGDAFAPGSLAVQEPRFGCDPLRPATIAKRDGAEYVLDGSKCFAPWLPGTEDVWVVAAEEGTAQVFLVPANASGLRATRESNMGIRGLPSAELELEGVRIPANARLGEERGADLGALLDRGRVGLAALAVGVARASYEVARDYAKERQAFGAPIATKQAIAFKIADMALEIDAARLLTWEAAWRMDRGLPATREATLAITQARDVALRVADDAVQVLGGHGYIRDYLPEMHLRNARGFAVFEALTLV
jgi:alkylation response protein AidB-like acyl-CoA dehydrogenase